MSAMLASAADARKKPAGRYDFAARYQDLEAEMFRLKFERAQLIEQSEVRELRDRRNREEIERLKDRLGELGVEVGGIVAKGREEGGGGRKGRKDGLERRGSSVFRKADAEVLEDISEEVIVEEGLRRKRNKLESSCDMLQHDVDNVKSELESERERFADVSDVHAKSESDHYRADAEKKSLQFRGERMAAEQAQLQDNCTSKSIELSETREKMSRAEEELSALRDRVGLLRGEETKLRQRMNAARDQTRAFRHDKAMSERQSARIRDKMLAKTDPKEYRRQRPERRERRKKEKAADAAWAASEVELEQLHRQQQQEQRQQAQSSPHFMRLPVGRRHSINEGAAGSVYVPNRHSSVRSLLLPASSAPGGWRRRCSNDDDDHGAPRKCVSMRSVLPNDKLAAHHRHGGGEDGAAAMAFLPRSWKRNDAATAVTATDGSTVVSALTTDTRSHRQGALVGLR